MSPDLTVTCRRCERTYRCTPLDDYYEATSTTDGLCFQCLLAEKAPDLAGKPHIVVIDP